MQAAEWVGGQPETAGKLVVVDVFMRYVMHRPLMVADEISAYMLVALSFLGFAYTWRKGVFKWK